MSLVCEENFGSGTFTDKTHVSPSRTSSPVSAIFSFLRMPEDEAYPLTARVIAARKPARCVPPSRCGNIVCEAQHILVIAIIPLKRCLDDDVIAFAGDSDRVAVLSGFVAIEIFNECLDAAIV